MGTILVAYERESEQTALEQLLTGRGHVVIRSGNGLAALEAARRNPPDAIVSDIVLPRMDGFALCRKWKQDERLQAVPFVFYTRRHDDPKYERFALELGAERFLARTVPPEELLGAIDELLPRGARKSVATVSPAVDFAAPTPGNGSAQHRAAALERVQQAQAQVLQRAEQEQQRLRAQVDELQAANERLQAGEARFRRVFEANPVPMWIADRATDGFIAVNDAALALYGYGRSEFLALKKHALAAGPTREAGHVMRHRRKDGVTISVEIVSREIEFDGRSADLIAVHDVTGRLAAAQRLEEELTAARAAMDKLRDERAASEKRLREEAMAAQSTLESLRSEHTALEKRLREEAAARRTALDALRDEHAAVEARLREEAAAQRAALESARTEHVATLRALQRSDVAIQAMIDAFVRMSERYDPFTAGSAARVAALAVAIGREAGLEGSRQHALRVAALLHDIGNVAVPAALLAKPGPLTDAETALMRAHVEEGVQLLEGIDFGAPVAEIIHQHHERCDGSGYPRNLQGEDILIEARILAIADTIEAMCSPRPYRPALGMDAAIEEINRGAGTLYDARLVAACTRLVRERGFKLPD